MSELRVSHHALARMAQRGIHQSDVDFIMAIGSEVEDGVIVLRRDIQAAERELKSMLKRIKRLEGKRLVACEGCLVTAYHASQSEERRLLRRA